MHRTQSHSELLPGSVLNARYRVRAKLEHLDRSFLGTDLESGEPVLMVELPAASANSVARGALVGHPHLSTLLDMIPGVGGSVGVFEYLPGPSLADVLADQGKLPENVAVTCGMALVNALTALHRRGAVHGMISPAAVVLSEQGGHGPWLSYALPPPPPSPYRSPERGTGPPSAADDLWAIGALLHRMLLGYAPPGDGYASLAAFPAAADLEPGLRDVLVSCLSARPEHRVRSAVELGELLARLEPTLAPTKITIPPSNPGGAAPGSGARSLRSLFGSSLLGRSPAGRAHVFGLGLLGLALVGGIGWLVRRAAPPGSSPSGGLTVPPPAVRSTEPDRALWSSLPPVPSEPEPVSLDSLPSGEELGRCIERQFPRKNWPTPPSIDRLCLTRDPREGARLLGRSLGVTGRARNPSWELGWWNKLGAYRMAAFSVVRAACCAHVEPLELPSNGDCGPLSPLLDGLGAAIATHRPYLDWLARYHGNLTCQERHGHAAALGLLGPPGDQQRDAFVRWADSR